MFKVKSIPSSLPSIPVFLHSPSYKVKYVDYRLSSRGKTNISAFRPLPQNYIFKLCSVCIFLCNKGPISLSVRPGHEQTSNWEIILPLPEFSWIHNILGRNSRREEWEFTQNSFGAISRDFQPHPAGRPSFKTVKTKTRAIFALII